MHSNENNCYNVLVVSASECIGKVFSAYMMARFTHWEYPDVLPKY